MKRGAHAVAALPCPADGFFFGARIGTYSASVGTTYYMQCSRLA